MSVPSMHRLTEAQLLARVSATGRGAAAADVAAGAAPGIPAGQASAGEGGAAEGRNDQIARGQGYVMLPPPVSTNRYWRNFKGRMVVSKEAIAYKARVAMICRMVGVPLLDGPVAVSLLIHPKLTKKGVASLVKQDIDNQIKVIFDGLNGVAWVDDSQVVKLQAEFADPIDGGGVSISVGAL